MADVVYDPYSMEIHENPYPILTRLRAEAPVYHNQERDFWAVSRYEWNGALAPAKEMCIRVMESARSRGSRSTVANMTSLHAMAAARLGLLEEALLGSSPAFHIRLARTAPPLVVAVLLVHIGLDSRKVVRPGGSPGRHVHGSGGCLCDLANLCALPAWPRSLISQVTKIIPRIFWIMEACSVTAGTLQGMARVRSGAGSGLALGF
jgi:hypothetical protein